MISDQDIAQNNTPPAGPVIFDVDTAGFEEQVIKTSFDKPVIVDFWAPWCGPCKQLMPILESVVNQYGGKAVLAKVNLDDNQELAQALQIQSVPAVFAFVNGRPVDAFQGMVPESQIKAFIDNAFEAARQSKPDALDIPAALKAAAEALAAGDLNTAHGVYAQIMQHDQKNAKAYAGLVRTFIAAGQVDQAAQLVENAPEDIIKDNAFAEAKTALELAQGAADVDFSALSAKVEKNPKDHAARIELAQAMFSAGEKEQAIEQLLESIRIERHWNDDDARKTLLKFFEALGQADPLTISARKSLSTILFS